MTERQLSVTALARRWGISRQRVFEIRADDSRMPRGQPLDPDTTKSPLMFSEPEIAEFERISGRKRVDVDAADQDQTGSEQS